MKFAENEKEGRERRERERKQERLLCHRSKQNKGIMQHLCVQYNDGRCLLSAPPSSNSIKKKKVDM